MLHLFQGHSVQDLVYTHLGSKHKRYIKHSSTILPVILYGCQTWSLTLREQQRLRVFKNRLLRYMLWTNGVTVDWRKCITRSFKVCIPYQILQGHQLKENEMGRAMAHTEQRINTYGVFEGKPEG